MKKIKTIKLILKLSLVSDFNSFNDSAIALAPSPPILFQPIIIFVNFWNEENKDYQIDT